jgi:hypothetical protein
VAAAALQQARGSGVAARRGADGHQAQERGGGRSAHAAAEAANLSAAALRGARLSGPARKGLRARQDQGARRRSINAIVGSD